MSEAARAPNRMRKSLRWKKRECCANRKALSPIGKYDDSNRETQACFHRCGSRLTAKDGWKGGWPFYLAGNYKVVWERYNGGRRIRLQNPSLEESMKTTLCHDAFGAGSPKPELTSYFGLLVNRGGEK
jgi:hypothetical protein